MKLTHSAPVHAGEFYGLPDHHESHIPCFEGIVERPAIMAPAVVPFEILIQDAFDGAESAIVCLGGHLLSWT
jgi:hypothetical protein